MVTIDVLTPKHREEWDKFTLASPEATFHHTFDWAETLHVGYGVIPSFWGLWLNSELAAIWPSCLVPAFGGRILFAHSTDGAPVVKEGLNPQLLGSMVAHVLETARKQGVLHWSFDVPQKSYFVKFAPRWAFKSAPSPRCTYTLDTTQEPEILWKRLASEVRTAVRKAKKHGLEAKDSQESDDFTAFLSAYQSTMRRRQLTDFRNPRSLVTLFSGLAHEGKAKLFVATDRNRLVAGVFLLLHKQTAHWWIGGSYPDSWRLRPNELLLWTAIEWASKSGYRHLDLGGTPSRRTHGLNIFKRHLGAERVELTRLTLPINPLKDILTTKLASTYRMFKERGLIPRSLADMILRGNLWFD